MKPDLWRLVDHVPFGHCRTRAFTAALRHDRLGDPWVIDGAMNAGIFAPYIETRLAPVLRPGDVVILDNLSSHKSPRAAAALRSVGAWFLFLLPYSPDLNSIEINRSLPRTHGVRALIFSKLKSLIRKVTDLPRDFYLAATGAQFVGFAGGAARSGWVKNA